MCLCVLGRSSEVSKSNLDLRDESEAEEEWLSAATISGESVFLSCLMVLIGF